MNDLNLFYKDLKFFLDGNRVILVVGLVLIGLITYVGKGNAYLNSFVLSLHIIGDIFMLLFMQKYSTNNLKPAAIYLLIGNLFFVLIGIIVVYYSIDGKNWQYLLGTLPFIAASSYQIFDAWNIRNLFLDYKFTLLTIIAVVYIYITKDIIYSHVWFQIFGSMVFALALSFKDSAVIFLIRLLSILILTIGSIIDVAVQYLSPNDIPSAAISSTIISLIAFIALKKNSILYINQNQKGGLEQKILMLLLKKR